MEASNCPFCGNVVYGDTAEQAGFNMGQHIATMHGNTEDDDE